MDELLDLRTEFRQGRLDEAEWFKKRNEIIRSPDIYQYAPDKDEIDSILTQVSLPHKDDGAVLHAKRLGRLGYSIFVWDAEFLEERAANKAYFAKRKGIQLMCTILKDESCSKMVREKPQQSLYGIIVSLIFKEEMQQNVVL